MVFKRIKLDFKEFDDFLVGLKFEIATAVAEQCRLLRVDIVDRADGDELKKNYAALAKSMRGMKQKGIVQFYAFSADFERNSTESVFLINKFPEFVELSSNETTDSFLFIKL